MDNEFADLEAELQRLRPRRPGSRLEQAVTAALEMRPGTVAVLPSRRLAPRSAYTTATTWSSWKWANWTVAVALVALMVTVSRLPVAAPESGAGSFASAWPTGVPDTVDAPPPDDPAPLRPVRAGRTLVGSEVEGLFELADGSPVQRVRDFYVDTIVWRDPDGRSQLRWEVPRESVRFVGLAAY